MKLLHRVLVGACILSCLAKQRWLYTAVPFIIVWSVLPFGMSESLRKLSRIFHPTTHIHLELGPLMPLRLALVIHLAPTALLLDILAFMWVPFTDYGQLWNVVLWQFEVLRDLLPTRSIKAQNSLHSQRLPVLWHNLLSKDITVRKFTRKNLDIFLFKASTCMDGNMFLRGLTEVNGRYSLIQLLSTHDMLLTTVGILVRAHKCEEELHSSIGIALWFAIRTGNVPLIWLIGTSLNKGQKLSLLTYNNGQPILNKLIEDGPVRRASQVPLFDTCKENVLFSKSEFRRFIYRGIPPSLPECVWINHYRKYQVVKSIQDSIKRVSIAASGSNQLLIKLNSVNYPKTARDICLTIQDLLNAFHRPEQYPSVKAIVQIALERFYRELTGFPLKNENVETAQLIAYLTDSLTEKGKKEVYMMQCCTGETVLHLALRKDDLSTLTQIITSIQNKDVRSEIMKLKDLSGNTAIHICRDERMMEIFSHAVTQDSWCEILRITNAENQTVFHSIIKGHQPRMFMTLLSTLPPTSKYPILAIQDIYGLTVLDISVTRIDKIRDLFKLIVDSVKSAELLQMLKLRDKYGETTLHRLVRENAPVNVYEYLVKDLEVSQELQVLDAVNTRGESPLDIAYQQGDSVRWLVKHRAKLMKEVISSTEDIEGSQ